MFDTKIGLAQSKFGRLIEVEGDVNALSPKSHL